MFDAHARLAHIALEVSATQESAVVRVDLFIFTNLRTPAASRVVHRTNLSIGLIFNNDFECVKRSVFICDTVRHDDRQHHFVLVCPDPPRKQRRATSPRVREMTCFDWCAQSDSEPDAYAADSGSSAHLFKLSHCGFAKVHVIVFRNDSLKPRGSFQPILDIFVPSKP